MSHGLPTWSPIAEALAHTAALEAAKSALSWQAGLMRAELELLRAEHARLTGAAPTAPTALPCARCGRPVEYPAVVCRDGCTPRVIHTITTL